MRWSCLLLLLAAGTVAGKVKKHKAKPNLKTGRAVLDRLSSTTISDASNSSPRGPSERAPSPLDVAPYTRVLASATCGDDGVEEFCREMPAKRGVVCSVCEGPSGAASRSHPAGHAVDGDPASWWQSPTFASGEQHKEVFLVATLPDEMELLHVIIKSGPSPRPLAWSLEVSTSESAEDWQLVRAFGDKEHCKKLWDLRPERRRRKARSLRGGKRTNRSEKLTCSTQFSGPRPLENGEMHVAIGGGRLARRVRIYFRAAQPAPSDRQYYTVRALTLAARCACAGHADKCDVSLEGAVCECDAGRCGARCAPCGPERAQCALDHAGDLLCFNCTDNRAGPLCDRCLPQHYVTTSDGPCLPCDCDAEGSDGIEDGSCYYDNQSDKVKCNCKEGVTGAKCDSCAIEGAVFPDCQKPRCRCDPRGIVDPNGICDEVCKCKENVIGDKCDTCLPLHFGLSASLPGGCRRCYCAGRAHSCAGDAGGGHDIPLRGGGWLVRGGGGALQPAQDEVGRPYVISYEVEGWDDFYWSTEEFNGSQLAAYGGHIRVDVYWSIVRGDTGGNPTRGPDVIIVGTDGTKLAYGDWEHETPGELELSIPLVEGGWYILDDEEHPKVSRTQLMDVLSEVQSLMVRAYYHTDQDEVRLQSALITGSPPSSLERCACYPGYSGAHCTSCAWTHTPIRRADNLRPPVECVPCACHGHANCTHVDGPCGPCEHNTTGPHCERCLPGHYGNPVQGGCSPCACPLFEPSNNFSPLCALSSPATNDYVCTQCADGHAGDKCELCDVGYWGSPLELGGRCRACECGGAPCDPLSGDCLHCPPRAEGPRCDICQEGYYPAAAIGSSAGVSCAACDCGLGALDSHCDTNGRCTCKDGWTGDKCDQCDSGFTDVSHDCHACSCGVAWTGAPCDKVTGACACRPGAAPPHCGTCMPDYYGISEAGCVGCNCSTLGSDRGVCDIRSGQCRCKPHVTGRACDTCEEGYWGLSAAGCRRCSCGAGASSCDPETGACACAVGVTGRHCDVCMPGYYGFGASGCLPCPSCPPGRICSASGACVCPQHAVGVRCDRCARGHWGRPPNCRPCDCGLGANATTCDPITGSCPCRQGWSGRSCSSCASGHFGERCRPCACDVRGTAQCGDAPCPCDQSGNCLCKENVRGAQCDQCSVGTFGLSAENPLGCTACYCFGRSARCEQAGLARDAIHLATPAHITVIDDYGGEPLSPDTLVTVKTLSQDTTVTVSRDVPVYLSLDKRFLGDRLLSYGGALRFKVEEEGGEELPKEVLSDYPLVRIYGPHNLVLDYFGPSSANGTNSARLYESLWRWRGRLSSRSALMAALVDVRGIALRATTRAPKGDRVHSLVLNVSLETAVPGADRRPGAAGVELCACPDKYAAGSCHRPAAGFWMPPPNYRQEHVGGTIVILVDGEAEPCNCNGRATSCDPVTGHCLNCTSGTSGPSCERCATGHYGSARAGCRPCPCPSAAHNHATDCSFVGGRARCYCKTGYTGHSCESCAPDYYRSGALCLPCGCVKGGALGAGCDETGRCQCRSYAKGEKCQYCVDGRSVMTEYGCEPCNNCTQTLLNSVDQISKDFTSRAQLIELERIPEHKSALDQYIRNSSRIRQELYHLNELDRNKKLLQNRVSNLVDNTRNLHQQSQRQKTDALKKKEKADSQSVDSNSELDEVIKLRRRIADQVMELDEFAQGERHLTAHRALKEARHLMRVIKDISLIDYIRAADDAYDAVLLQQNLVEERDRTLNASRDVITALTSRLSDWLSKADDLTRLVDRVWEAGDVVAATAQNVRPKIDVIIDKARACDVMNNEISKLHSSNVTALTASTLQNTEALLQEAPVLLRDLLKVMEAAEEKEGILYNILPSYKQKYLDEVEKHVNDLGTKARQYKSLFSGAKTAAAEGVSAASGWKDVTQAIKDAEKLALEAEKTVHKAAELARRKKFYHEARKLKNKSQTLLDDSMKVLMKAEDHQSTVDQLERGVDRVSLSLRALGWAERELVLPTIAPADLTEPTAAAERIFSAARALYEEVTDIRQRARYNLKRQMHQLQQHGDAALGAAEEHLSQIRSDSARASELLSSLTAAAAARAREHSLGDSRLGPKLDHLKETLNRARDAADSIAVSITSPANAPIGCSRAYAVTSLSPSVTRISISFSFDKTVKDGPLFHLETEDDRQNMRLYVQDQRLKLKWSIGGQGELVLPHLLEANQDEGESRDVTSYRIEIERIWHQVRLTVERGGTATTVTSTANSSQLSSVRAVRATRLWLGAPGGSLPACVHSLHHDDNRIGLWNFALQNSDAVCTGCVQRDYKGSQGSAPLYQFAGAGYAEVARAGGRPYDRRQFSVAFVFNTYDRDALLFMAHDGKNNRSVSVSLVNCLVTLRVQYGASRLVITASGRHCHGRPVHVQAIRVFGNNYLEKGSLRVNGEEQLGSPSPPVQSPSDLPELESANYWVGGLPPGAQGDDPPLRGCLGALLVDRQGYDLLDTSKRRGLERCGANNIIRSAQFEGSGYLELPAPALKRRSSIGFSVRARAAGVLLQRGKISGEEKVAQLSVEIMDGGELKVVASAGKGELKLVSNNTSLLDGRVHTIRLVRAHKQLEVYLDEVLTLSGALAGGGLSAGERGGFLGGGPGARGGFKGTIADYIVNGSLVGFETALESSGVRLGRADQDPVAHAGTEPRALHEQPDTSGQCGKVRSFVVERDAVRFNGGGYAVVRAPARASLSFALSLRTHRSDALLAVIPGSKSKKHYLSLLIKDHRLKLTLRGKQKKEIVLDTIVSDGEWHAISVRLSPSRAVVSVGAVGAGGRPPRRLALAPRLYLGGLPDRNTLPNLPEQVWSSPPLVGCVRRVSVRARGTQLAKGEGLGQCFPRVAPAAYFNGDAYAVWSKSWQGSSEVRLEFRTAAANGLLLAASDFTLELRDGQVVSCWWGGCSSWSGRWCDDDWHVVSWRGGRLQLDAAPPAPRAAHPLAADPPDLPGPLYVGGVPENIADTIGGGRENFKGCLREVSIGGDKRDWTKMDSYNNVLLDSCPTS